jgi:DNA-binding response OmpR family regulator
MDDRHASVLLVEDDEDFRHIVARHLRTRGFDVHETSSCEAAVATLNAGLRPGIVLLDVNLPGDTGWDLLRGPALSAAGSPPVVIASAITISPRRLDEFGVAGYLPKPFPLETLIATIDRLTTDGAAPRPRAES